MKPDPSSARLVPRFLSISSLGLTVSVAGLILGETIGRYVPGVSTAEVVVRLVGATLRGVGLAGTLLFLLLVAAALLFKVLTRVTSRGTGA